MRIACWIPKATNKHSQYVILIGFPQKQWLQERASLPVLLFSEFDLHNGIFRDFSQNCDNRLLASSYLSVFPHGTRFRTEGFASNLISVFFLKMCPEHTSFIKI